MKTSKKLISRIVNFLDVLGDLLGRDVVTLRRDVSLPRSVIVYAIQAYQIGAGPDQNTASHD